MNLHEINAKVRKKPDRHRVGRGPGSGSGTTAGRGMNGAKARSGHKRKYYAEGGQISFVRRIPKRGFNNKIFRRAWAFVNLKDLNVFADGDVVTPEECLRRGIIPKLRSGLKVLGVGTLERKLTIRAHRASASAREAIEAAGGTLELSPAPWEDADKAWKSKRGQGRATQRRVAAIKRSARS